MGTLGKCPHCKENIYLGSGFSGPNYQNADGTPFDPLLAEECPECGLAALHVLSLAEHPGKLFFVHHSGERQASGCLVDDPGFRTVSP